MLHVLTKCKNNILVIEVLNSIIACNIHVDAVCVFLALHKMYNENRRIMNYVIIYHIYIILFIFIHVVA